MDRVAVALTFLGTVFVSRMLMYYTTVIYEFKSLPSDMLISGWLVFVVLVTAAIAYFICFHLVPTKSWAIAGLVSSLVATGISLTSTRWGTDPPIVHVLSSIFTMLERFAFGVFGFLAAKKVELIQIPPARRPKSY